jgi:hypothetical protein
MIRLRRAEVGSSSDDDDRRSDHSLAVVRRFGIRAAGDDAEDVIEHEGSPPERGLRTYKRWTADRDPTIDDKHVPVDVARRW